MLLEDGIPWLLATIVVVLSIASELQRFKIPHYCGVKRSFSLCSSARWSIRSETELEVAMSLIKAPLYHQPFAFKDQFCRLPRLGYFACMVTTAKLERAPVNRKDKLKFDLLAVGWNPQSLSLSVLNPLAYSHLPPCCRRRLGRCPMHFELNASSPSLPPWTGRALEAGPGPGMDRAWEERWGGGKKNGRENVVASLRPRQRADLK